MRVLVGCESSGEVRDAFRRRGIEAWSNDLDCEQAEGEFPEFHLVGDVLHHIEHSGPWDLLIVHPPCTYLCSSGLHWNHRVPGRDQLTEEALKFVRELLDSNVPHIALENPRGRIGTAIRKADQTINPYNFGHDASKATCLWLKNLPTLELGEYVEPQYGCKPCRTKFPMELGVDGCPSCHGLDTGKPRKVWGNQTASGQNNLPPSANRWKERSRTYRGIAEAMAQQWGDYVLHGI